jgi:hypothetical protein
LTIAVQSIVLRTTHILATFTIKLVVAVALANIVIACSTKEFCARMTFIKVCVDQRPFGRVKCRMLGTPARAVTPRAVWPEELWVCAHTASAITIGWVNTSTITVTLSIAFCAVEYRASSLGTIVAKPAIVTVTPAIFYQLRVHKPASIRSPRAL